LLLWASITFSHQECHNYANFAICKVNFFFIESGWNLEKQSNFFWVNRVHPNLHPPFFPSWAPPPLLHIYFHCSYMYSYYNYSPTLCIKCCWVSAISYPDLIKNFITLQIPLIWFEVERRVWQSKEAQRQDQYGVTLTIGSWP
jgi:hypothetical protein